MPLPHALFVDMDDTLIIAHNDAETAWRTVVGGFAGELGCDDTGDRADVLIDALAAASESMWTDPESHRLWRHKMPEARREVARRACLATGIGDPAMAAALGDAFAAHRDRAMRLFDGTIEVLEALRAAGVRMALVTNGGSKFQRAKIDRFDLARHFDHVLIEEEFGVGKPEDIVYRHLLDHFAVDPSDTWMIGDNLEWEVVAPQRHGIRGIWFDGYGKGLPSATSVRPDAVVATLGELLNPAFMADA